MCVSIIKKSGLTSTGACYCGSTLSYLHVDHKGSSCSWTLSPIRTRLTLSHFDLLYFTGKVTVTLQPKGHNLQEAPAVIFVKETAAFRYLHSQTGSKQNPPVISDSHPVVGLWFSNCFTPTHSSLVLWLSCRNASVPGLELHVSLCCCQSTSRQCSWFGEILVPWCELWAGRAREEHRLILSLWKGKVLAVVSFLCAPASLLAARLSLLVFLSSLVASRARNT